MNAGIVTSTNNQHHSALNDTDDRPLGVLGNDTSRVQPWKMHSVGLSATGLAWCFLLVMRIVSRRYSRTATGSGGAIKNPR